MNQFKIFAPRWSTKDILAADWKVGDRNQIIIEAKRKDGSLYYPEPFYMTGEQMRKYPLTSERMRIIPLKDLSTTSFIARGCSHAETHITALNVELCNKCKQVILDTQYLKEPVELTNDNKVTRFEVIDWRPEGVDRATIYQIAKGYAWKHVIIPEQRQHLEKLMEGK